MNQLTKRIDIDSLSPAQARVVIAKDVLAATRAKKFIPTNGTYCAIGKIDVKVGKGLRPALKKMKDCRVCALGAMFIAKVARFNDFTVSANDISGLPWDSEDFETSRDAITDTLGRYFDSEQMTLIENAFESCGYYADDDGSRSRALKFCCQLKTAKERLTCIMRNIIINKGTFVP